MHKRTLDISTSILLITHDRQRRTEKKKAQYLITQEVPPKCNYMYPQYWNIPLGFLAGETSVPTVGATEHVTIPRHMCAYICLLKHEIALYTESTEAVCGKSDCLNTPFVTQSFHYILGIL